MLTTGEKRSDGQEEYSQSIFEVVLKRVRMHLARIVERESVNVGDEMVFGVGNLTFGKYIPQMRGHRIYVKNPLKNNDVVFQLSAYNEKKMTANFKAVKIKRN